MTNLPSCPLCGSADRVENMPPPLPRPWDPLVEAPSPWPYLCVGCDWVFTGTGDEWERMKWKRAEHQTRSDRSTQPEGEL